MQQLGQDNAVIYHAALSRCFSPPAPSNSFFLRNLLTRSTIGKHFFNKSATFLKHLRYTIWQSHLALLSRESKNFKRV